MIATAHVIISGTAGLLVGTVTQNPALAFAAGVVSHLLCDTIPHIDHPDAPKIGKDIVFTKKVIVFALVDSLLAFFLTLYMWVTYFNFPDLTQPYIWGALGGYLPDFIDNVPWWRFKVRTLPVLKQFHMLHESVHELWREKYFPMPKHWRLGTVTQILVVGICLFYIFS